MSRTKGKAQEKFQVLVAPQGVGKSSTAAFLSYAEAKALVTKSGVKTVGEFHKWRRPAGMPSNPTQAYEYSGWQSWSKFLGITLSAPITLTTVELNHAER